MAEKMCVVCGADVAQKPRVKDERGQYHCRPCFDAKRTAVDVAKMAGLAVPAGAKEKAGAPKVGVAASAPAAMSAVAAATAVKGGTPGQSTGPKAVHGHGADEGDPILAALVEDSVQKTTYCPSCSGPMKVGSVICTSCGFNTESQQALKTKIQRAPREKGGKAESGRRRVRMTLGFPPWLHLIIVAGVFGPLFAMGMDDPDSAMIYGGLAGLYYLGMYILMIIFAFKDEMGRWGLWGIIGFFTGIGQILLIVATLMMSERGNMKVGALASVILVIGNWLLIAQGTTGG